jgi:hypothetical protein
MRKFLKIIGLISLFLILILLLVVLFLVVSFRSWEKKFLEGMDNQYLVSQGLDFEQSITEKTEKYILSEDDTDFITFSTKEIASVILFTLRDITEGTGLEVTNVYIEPSIGLWKICARGKLSDINIHSWLCVDVKKDSMQTAQLYLNEIELQGIKISNIYPKALTMANKGIADSLTTANENGFVGRILENIELLESSIVIKGSLW